MMFEFNINLLICDVVIKAVRAILEVLLRLYSPGRPPFWPIIRTLHAGAMENFLVLGVWIIRDSPVGVILIWPVRLYNRWMLPRVIPKTIIGRVVCFSIIVINVHPHGENESLDVPGADGFFGLVLRGPQGGHQDREQNRYYGDNYQQLN